MSHIPKRVFIVARSNLARESLFAFVLFMHRFERKNISNGTNNVA